MCTTPIGLPSLTTNSAVIFVLLSRSSAVPTRASGAMVFGVLGHHGIDLAAQLIRRAEVTAHVAVGDDAHQLAARVDNADAAQPLLADDHDRLAHGRAGRDQRHGVAVVHDIADEMEAGAEAAAGVEDVEIFRGEAAILEQRDRQRVAEGELHQRRGRRRQAVRAGLLGARQEQHDVGLAAKRAVGGGGHGDQRNAEAARMLDDGAQFGRLAGPRQRDDDVVGRDPAEVAVACLGGCDEEGRCAGRGQGRGDLAGDVARSCRRR